MVSEKRLEANRANARKSTGPRTPEGKARSRANGLKHGLTGAGVVLAGEDGPAVAERVEAWASELRPRGEVEMWLVARAATASVRLDRCVRRECAKIDQAVRQAAGRWDGREIGHAQAVGARLIEDPAASVAELKRSAAGCDWMLEKWAVLRKAAAASGWLGQAQLRYALRLMGRAADPTASEPGAAPALWGFGLAAIPEPDLEEIEHYYGLSPAEDATDQERVEAADAMIPADPAGRDGLLAAIDEQVARLSAWRAELWEVEGPGRAATLDRVRFDASPEAALMRRYETSATTDLHRALERLARVRKEGLAEVEDDLDTSAQDEPIEEPSPTPTDDPSPRPANLAGDPSPPESQTPVQDEPIGQPESPPSSAQDEPIGGAEPAIVPGVAAEARFPRPLALALPILMAWLTLFAASGVAGVTKAAITAKATLRDDFRPPGRPGSPHVGPGRSTVPPRTCNRLPRLVTRSTEDHRDRSSSKKMMISMAAKKGTVSTETHITGIGKLMRADR